MGVNAGKFSLWKKWFRAAPLPPATRRENIAGFNASSVSCRCQPRTRETSRHFTLLMRLRSYTAQKALNHFSPTKICSTCVQYYQSVCWQLQPGGGCRFCPRRFGGRAMGNRVLVRDDEECLSTRKLGVGHQHFGVRHLAFAGEFSSSSQTESDTKSCNRS